MKLSATFTLLVVAYTSSGVVGFRVGSDGNKDLMSKAVADLVKPPQSSAGDLAPPLRNQIMGTETPCLYEYWSRPDIHTFGNMGLGGGLHAALAPLATRIIDDKAYDGVDVRKKVSRKLRLLVNKPLARVVDLCCGVGMSTRALEAGFSDAEFVVGVDTSSEMLSMAQAISGYEEGVRRFSEAIKKALHGRSNAITEVLGVGDTNPSPPTNTTVQVSYRLGNAENTELRQKVDLVTIMFGFHEVPMQARARIVNEARRLLKRGGTLAVVDISPDYTPSDHMLAGEPFVKEYQQNIDGQLRTSYGFALWKRKRVVPGHVNLWLLTAV